MKCYEFVLNFLSTAIGAGIGVIGAYKIYRKQLHDSVQKEKESRLTEEKEFLIYYKNLLISFAATAKLKWQCIEEYIKKQEQSTPNIVAMNSVSNDPFFKVKNIDNSLLFRAWMDIFNDENKIVAYDKLRINLDYIEGVFGNIDSIYNRHARKSFDTLEKTNQVFIDFVDNLVIFLNDWEKKMGGCIPEGSDEARLLQYFEEHKRRTLDEQTRLSYTFNEARLKFIEPIEPIMKKHYFDYPQELISLFRKILSDLDIVEMQTRHLMGEFQKPKEYIEKALADIGEACKKLDSI